MSYFSIEELCRSDKAVELGIDNTPNEEVRRNLQDLIDNVLDPLREWYGKPIPVNSGYRCAALNKAVGGVSNSFHLFGKGVDIDVRDDNENKRLFDYIKDNLPFTELGWEHGGAWVHVGYDKNHIDKEIFSA